MNFKYIAIVAVIAVTLVGATEFATDMHLQTEKNAMERVQIIEANECGNGELGLNISFKIKFTL